MPCKQWKDDWIAHLYGELEEAEETRLRAHVADCPSCRETLEELSESRRLVQASAPYVPAAPRVVMMQPRRFAWAGWSFAAGLACALLVFVVGLQAASLLTTGDPAPAGELLTRADLERELHAQQEQFDLRLAAYENRLGASAPQQQAALTREQLEEAVTRVRNEVAYERSRDFGILLNEISATNVRTADWIDENRAVLRYALRQGSTVGDY